MIYRSLFVPESHSLDSKHCDKGLCNEGDSWPWPCGCGGLVHHFTFNGDSIERCERCGWFRNTYY